MRTHERLNHLKAEKIKKRIIDEFSLAGLIETNELRLLLKDVLKVIDEDLKNKNPILK